MAVLATFGGVDTMLSDTTFRENVRAFRSTLSNYYMSDGETYEELDAKLKAISNRRDASKLWVGCYTYSQKDSLHSDWPLHLLAVRQMVPNVFASAHVN